jgi:hypothetical protein
MRLVKPVLLVCVLAAVTVAVVAPGAFAGAKPIQVTVYDPAHHVAVPHRQVDLYSFRWLIARTPLRTVRFAPGPGPLLSHGSLVERKPNRPSRCHGTKRSCLTRTRVWIRFTHLMAARCARSQGWSTRVCMSAYAARPTGTSYPITTTSW